MDSTNRITCMEQKILRRYKESHCNNLHLVNNPQLKPENDNTDEEDYFPCLLFCFIQL